MAYGDEMMKSMQEFFQAHPDEPAVSLSFVEKMLETNWRLAQQSAQQNEREEIICRLIASGMPVEEVSIILKIRKEEIQMVRSNNSANKIPDYTDKLKKRRKSRDKLALKQTSLP